jgi:hypothetical protein
MCSRGKRKTSQDRGDQLSDTHQFTMQQGNIFRFLRMYIHHLWTTNIDFASYKLLICLSKKEKPVEPMSQALRIHS